MAPAKVEAESASLSGSRQVTPFWTNIDLSPDSITTAPTSGGINRPQERSYNADHLRAGLQIHYRLHSPLSLPSTQNRSLPDQSSFRSRRRYHHPGSVSLQTHQSWVFSKTREPPPHRYQPPLPAPLPLMATARPELSLLTHL